MYYYYYYVASRATCQALAYPSLAQLERPALAHVHGAVGSCKHLLLIGMQSVHGHKRTLVAHTHLKVLRSHCCICLYGLFLFLAMFTGLFNDSVFGLLSVSFVFGLFL